MWKEVIQRSLPTILKMAGDLSKEVVSRPKKQHTLQIEEIQSFLEKQAQLNMEMGKTLSDQDRKIKNQGKMIYISLILNVLGITTVLLLLFYFN